MPPPYAINIQITTDVDDIKIVPILAKSKMIEVGRNKRPIHYKSHAIELGFSYTFWKVQGATLDAAILVLNDRPFPPYINVRHFYVGISRVTSNDNLRIWPIGDINTDTCQHLLKKPQRTQESQKPLKISKIAHNLKKSLTSPK